MNTPLAASRKTAAANSPARPGSIAPKNSVLGTGGDVEAAAIRAASGGTDGLIRRALRSRLSGCRVELRKPSCVLVIRRFEKLCRFLRSKQGGAGQHLR